MKVGNELLSLLVRNYSRKKRKIASDDEYALRFIIHYLLRPKRLRLVL